MTRSRHIYTYSPLVFRYLRSLCGDAAVAEELDRRRPSTAPTPILIRSRRQQARDMAVRHAKTRTAKHRRHSARTVGADALETLPAETDFVERFLDREQAQQIYRHVHELGAQYKEVFLLRTLGELSFRDIADIFGKSEPWAKVTYFRAKTRSSNEWRDRHEPDHLRHGGGSAAALSGRLLQRRQPCGARGAHGHLPCLPGAIRAACGAI